MNKTILIFVICASVQLIGATNNVAFATDESATDGGTRVVGPNEIKGGNVGEHVGRNIGVLTTNPRDGANAIRDRLESFEEGGRATGAAIGRQMDESKGAVAR